MHSVTYRAENYGHTLKQNLLFFMHALKSRATTSEDIDYSLSIIDAVQSSRYRAKVPCNIHFQFTFDTFNIF